MRVVQQKTAIGTGLLLKFREKLVNGFFLSFLFLKYFSRNKDLIYGIVVLSYIHVYVYHKMITVITVLVTLKLKHFLKLF